MRLYTDGNSTSARQAVCCWPNSDDHAEAGCRCSCAIYHWTMQSLADFRSLCSSLQGGVYHSYCAKARTWHRWAKFILTDIELARIVEAPGSPCRVSADGLFVFHWPATIAAVWFSTGPFNWNCCFTHPERHTTGRWPRRFSCTDPPTPWPEKNAPPKHVKITLWIENVSDYFSLYHEMPSFCNVHVKFHDN